MLAGEEEAVKEAVALIVSLVREHHVGPLLVRLAFNDAATCKSPTYSSRPCVRTRALHSNAASSQPYPPCALLASRSQFE